MAKTHKMPSGKMMMDKEMKETKKMKPKNKKGKK